MQRHGEISGPELHRQQITLGGNSKLEIYGKRNCCAGKKMKRANRVFFRSRAEASRQGFRPCGHCLNSDYKKWKYGLI
jgi:hypothetical protein